MSFHQQFVRPRVVQGGAKILTVNLVSQSTGLPFDASAATEIVASFLNTDGSTLEKKLSTAGIINLDKSTFQVSLSAADTALMAPSNANPNGISDIVLQITISGVLTIINLLQSFYVDQTPFTP